MSATAVETGTLSIRLDRLFVPENVREDDDEFIARLERSVKARGKIISPVEVIDADPAVHGEAYDHVLVAGFRRAEVARRLGRDTIPGVYGDAEHEQADRAVENMVRKDLSPYEEAVAIQRVLAEGKSEDQAAELLGMSKQLVTRRVKLLELPDAAQRLIGESTLTLAAVEPMRTIAAANPALLDAVVEFIGEYAEEMAPDDFAHRPLSILMAAVEETELDVFAAPLGEVPLKATEVLPDDEPTQALIAEAGDLHKQLHRFSYNGPHIRFTEAEIDRARAAGVLLEYGEEQPLVTDLAMYQDLCRTAIAAGVQDLKQQAEERTEEEQSAVETPGEKDKPARDDERTTLEKKHRAEMRQIAATAHGANLALGDSLRAGLTTVDPDDMDVARFFVYGLLGQDNPNGWARDTVESAIALRGIRFVIGDFREDKTKERKDGSRGALRIAYGDGDKHENQSHWLWKYLDGARSAGELYGRALVVIAAEQYASRLVVPSSQQTKPLTWPSRKDTALKALKKLAGPHIAPTLKALEKAITDAGKEYREALKALDSKEPDSGDTAETEVEQDATETAAAGGVPSQALSFIQGQPGITIPELAARMGVKQNRLYRALPELEHEGKVSKQGRGWHPTDAPKETLTAAESKASHDREAPETEGKRTSVEELPGLLRDGEQIGTSVAPGVRMLVLDAPGSQPSSPSSAPSAAADSTVSEPAGITDDSSDPVPGEDVVDASADIEF
jgi:ParB/RepB/Spo0J family partition protein